MQPSKRVWQGFAVFSSVLFIFFAIEASLSKKYSRPTRAIERRHLIWPKNNDFVGIFGEFLGPATIDILAPKDSEMSTKNLKGLRMRTGAYGQQVIASSVELKNAQGDALCKSQVSSKILENRWTNIELTCVGSPLDQTEQLRVHVDVPKNQKWAIYKTNNGRPSLQLWFDDPTFKAEYLDARNYGQLWDSAALTYLRWLARTIIAIGLVIALSGFRLRAHVPISGAFIIWFGLLWTQFFETVPLHNPDEPAHAVGALRSVTAIESWPGEYERLLSLGSSVQFKETYARVENPLISKKDGERQVSADGNFISPERRSALYGLVAKPLARVALAASEEFSQICSDPSTYLRALLTGLISLFGGLGVLVLNRERRISSAIIFLTVCSIPSVLASYLTIWNYGILTVLGVFFCVALIPEGSQDSYRRLLLLASALIPILGEFARSQILWFAIGPLVVVSAVVFIQDLSLVQRLRFIGRCMGISLLVCAALMLLLGTGFIPDKEVLIRMKLKLCELGGFACSNAGDTAVSFLFLLQVVAWSLSAVCLTVMSELCGLARSKFHKQLKALQWTWATLAILLIIKLIKKAWSVNELSFLDSIAFTHPIPSFSEHVYDAYRALLSQTFTMNQDYFLIQTFYMAYGWLEVTGHNIVYFIYRNFLHLGVLSLLVSSVFSFRKTIQFYTPLLAAFVIYFGGIWYASWTGHFTIVGRFFFPAIGLIYSIMISALADVIGTFNGARFQSCLQRVASIVFLLVALSAIYGTLYVLPLRFAVGYDL